MREECLGCNLEKFLVNRKYKLCEDCNHFRLHGKTKYESLQEQQTKSFLKKNTSKPKQIRQVGSKQSVVNGLLSKLKNKVRKEAQDQDMYYCWGCGIAGEQLDCSHILSVKQRKDLELDQENINLFCRTCHNKWEHGNIVQQTSLLTFEKDLLYIKERDEMRYNKIIEKI